MARGEPVTIEPYYQTPDGAIRIYNARWEDVLTAGVFAPKDIALVHADPPYGVAERTDRKARGRVGALAKASALVGASARRVGAVGMPHDFPPVVGDDRPFSPQPLLDLSRPTVLWGANHYAGRFLSSGPSWLVWDKREEQTPDDNADAEIAWSDLGGPVRVFRHWWRGALRKTEKEHIHLHPTQKPEALSAWVFAHAEARKKLKRGDTILVPYMGSGPDLRPAMAAGYKVIACDVEEWCCRTAVSARLGAMPRPEPSDTLGPLFASPLTSA